MSAHYQYCTTYEKQVAVPVMVQATPGYELLLGRHSTDYTYLITAVVYEYYRCYSFSLSPSPPPLYVCLVCLTTCSVRVSR